MVSKGLFMREHGALEKRSILLIVVPYHAGIPGHRVGAGPSRIMANNLIPRLEKLDVAVSVHEISPVDDYYDGDIGRSFEIIIRVAKVVRDAVEDFAFPIVLAGNCNTSIGVAAGLRQKELELVWFDAHADMEMPDLMRHGYFDSMGVSMMTGECFRNYMATIPGHETIPLERFTFCGVREVSDSEYSKLVHGPAKVVFGNTGDAADLRESFTKRLQEVLQAPTDAPTLVHIDVDCLDRQIGKANDYSTLGGLYGRDLLECLDLVALMRKPVALTVASFDPNLEGAEFITQIATNAIVHLMSMDTSREGQSIML